jgi:hypothetical protein
MTTAPIVPAKHAAPNALLNLHLVETQPASTDHHTSSTPAHLDSYGCYSCGCEVESSVQAQAGTDHI